MLKPPNTLLSLHPGWQCLLIMAFVALAGCSRATARSDASSSDLASGSSVPTVAAASSSSNLDKPSPPRQADVILEKIPLDGFGPASLALPVGSSSPRPIVVALHGHAVRPEHACTHWSMASYGYAFVLCPHGLPANAAASAPVTFGSPDATYREVLAAVGALRLRYKDRVAPGPVVLAGYSMGARLALRIAQKSPSLFPRIVLGEGGYGDLDQGLVEGFARSGIRKVLLVCSTQACVSSYEQVKGRFDRARLPCQVASSGGTVHMFEKTTALATKTLWPWLVDDDPQWDSLNE